MFSFLAVTHLSTIPIRQGEGFRGLQLDVHRPAGAVDHLLAAHLPKVLPHQLAVLLWRQTDCLGPSDASSSSKTMRYSLPSVLHAP